MNETLKKLVISLGLDSKQLDKGLKQTQSNMLAFANKMKGVFAGVISVAAIKSAVQAYQEFNLQISNAQQLMGGNVSEIAAMSRAMKRFGGDTNSVVGAMKAMRGHISAAKFGQGALFDVSKKYGLSLNLQSTEKGILSLARQLKGLDRNTRNTILSQLGLDEAMQRAFADGGVALQGYLAKQRAIGVETDEDIEKSNQFNNAMLDLKDMFAALNREIIRNILPVIKGFVGFIMKFVEAVRKNKAFMIAFFIGLAAVLGTILVVLGKIAIANIAAFAPFYAIAAIIVAIILVVEDLYYYFMGWDSVTGDLVKRFPLLGKLLEPLKPLVMSIVDFFKSIVAFAKDPSWETFGAIFENLEKVIVNLATTALNAFINLFDLLKERFPALTPLWDGLKNSLIAIKNLVLELWESIKDFINAILEGNFDKLVESVKRALLAVVDFIKSIWENSLGMLGKAGNWALEKLGFGGEVPQAPSVPQAANNRTANVNVNNNVNQTFNAANMRPQDIQSATEAGLSNSVNAVRQTIGNGLE